LFRLVAVTLVAGEAASPRGPVLSMKMKAGRVQALLGLGADQF
jgi:hypothetical protein